MGIRNFRRDPPSSKADRLEKRFMERIEKGQQLKSLQRYKTILMAHVTAVGRSCGEPTPAPQLYRAAVQGLQAGIRQQTGQARARGMT
jgi:hypothetical protein